MHIFFPDIDTLHRFTLELDCHQDEVKCLHCGRSGQFVAHGFVYKQESSSTQQVVAKRILCSKRGGRGGCGHTRQLYLAEVMPGRRYTTGALLVFIGWLFAGVSVSTAYRAATQKPDPSHGYRWLNRLWHRLSDYRAGLNQRSENSDDSYPDRPRKLRLILSTLKALFKPFPGQPCRGYQAKKQTPFL